MVFLGPDETIGERSCIVLLDSIIENWVPQICPVLVEGSLFATVLWVGYPPCKLN